MCDIFSCLIGMRNNRLRVFRHSDPDVHSRLYALMREHGYAKAIPLIKALP